MSAQNLLWHLMTLSWSLLASAQHLLWNQITLSRSLLVSVDSDYVVMEPIGVSLEPAVQSDHVVMEPIGVVHHVPSFIGALGCVASVTFAQMLSAVCSVGLTGCRVRSLHLLAALVAELVEAFPGGLFLRTTWPFQYWLLQGGVAQPSCLSSGCSTHIFVQRDAFGHFSPMVHVPRQVGAYNFRFSVAYVAFWDILPPLQFPDCFFRALGLDRFATVAAAKAALKFFRGGLRHQFAVRLLRLARPNIYVSGFDVQMFLILLPAFFSAGLLLLLEKGVLVYLSSASAPHSVLPEAEKHLH